MTDEERAEMKQYCRYCSYLCTGNGTWCEKKQKEIADSTAKTENQTLGNNNAKLLHLYGECHKENTELKTFCKKLIKTNNELRNNLRKYEIVPDVDYLSDGTEVYKENVGDNPYDTK